MDQIVDFQANADGTASLAVVFDVSGMGFNAALTSNYTRLTLPAQSTAWTQATASVALASQIATAKTAFLAAAPNYVSPSAMVVQQEPPDDSQGS
jgi:cystathionine beta-lyase/cystathionine gamma-synthase